MKSNTLEDVLRVLKNPSPEDYVQVDQDVISRAKKCINAMFEYTQA